MGLCWWFLNSSGRSLVMFQLWSFFIYYSLLLAAEDLGLLDWFMQQSSGERLPALWMHQEDCYKSMLSLVSKNKQPLWSYEHVPVPGISYESSSVRRRPNAFNLVHQLNIIVKTGVPREKVMQSIKEPLHSCLLWCACSQVNLFLSLAEDQDGSQLLALQIGRTELDATENLFLKVPDVVSDHLGRLVRQGSFTIAFKSTQLYLTHCQLHFSYMHHMPHLPGTLRCSVFCNMMLWLQVTSTWTIAQEQGLWVLGQDFWQMTSTCCNLCVPVLKATGLVWRRRCGKAGGQRKWTLVTSCHLWNLSIAICDVYGNCFTWISLTTQLVLTLLLQTKEALQKVCGAYLACVHHFKSTVSDSFFSSTIDDIRKAHLAIIQVGAWEWMRYWETKVWFLVHQFAVHNDASSALVYWEVLGEARRQWLGALADINSSTCCLGKGQYLRRAPPEMEWWGSLRWTALHDRLPKQIEVSGAGSAW